MYDNNKQLERMPINLRDQILKSQISYYQGLICKYQQNVEIYLNQPVGIGEHPDIVGAIVEQLDIIAEEEERLAVIDKHFMETH